MKEDITMTKFKKVTSTETEKALSPNKKVVVKTTKEVQAAAKLAVQLFTTINVQNNDAKEIVGKLTLAYVIIDTKRAASKGGTQLTRSEIMSEINDMAGYNPGPSSGILAGDQVARVPRFDSLIRRVVETIIIERAPKSKRPAKLTLSKSGHLQRPYSLIKKTMGKTKNGKAIRNTDNTLTDLTVKEVSEIYASVHPTKKRGTKKSKLDSARAQIADAEFKDMDTCLTMLSAVIIDQVVNGKGKMEDFFNKKQLAKFDKLVAAGNSPKVGSNNRMLANAKAYSDNRRKENVESAANVAKINGEIIDNKTSVKKENHPAAN